MVLPPNTFLRDYETDGVPSSGPHKVNKSEFRDYLNSRVEQASTWPSITDAAFGAAVSNTNAINSTAINAALAYCATNGIRMLWVPPGTFQCNDNITNANGVYFIGPGTIIVGSSGKPISFNGTDLNKTVAGWQNLISFHAYLSAAINVVNIVLVGDSTIQGVGGAGELTQPSAYPDAILTEIGRQRGYSPHVNNLGVGGTGIANLDLTASWVTNTANSLVIIGYGTNDAAGGIAAYASTLRSKLTTLRAARPGDLAIILKSPMTGTDTFLLDGSLSLRDERFMRQVHDVNVQMVQEFNVCAIDTFSMYWYMRGSYGGAHMDTLSDSYPLIYRTDAHIHPRDLINSKIWGDIIGPIVFPESVGTLTGKNNRSVYYNALDTDFAPLASSGPGFFKYGLNSFPVNVAQGWPVTGQGWNYRGANSSYQIVADGAGISYTRSGVSSFPATWFALGAAAVATTLGTNVTLGATGTTMMQAGAFAASTGFWSISGNIVIDQVLLTVPAVLRPSRATTCTIATGVGTTAGVIEGLVNTTGTIIAKAAVTAPVRFGAINYVIN